MEAANEALERTMGEAADKLGEGMDEVARGEKRQRYRDSGLLPEVEKRQQLYRAMVQAEGSPDAEMVKKAWKAQAAAVTKLKRTIRREEMTEKDPKPIRCLCRR